MILNPWKNNKITKVDGEKSGLRVCSLAVREGINKVLFNIEKISIVFYSICIFFVGSSNFILGRVIVRTPLSIFAVLPSSLTLVGRRTAR